MLNRAALSRSGVSPFVHFEQDAPEPENVPVGYSFCSGLPCSNFTTSRGRRRLAQMILFVALLPVFVLVIQNTYNVALAGKNVAMATDMKQHILLGVEIGTLIHSLQLERGVSALYVSAEDKTVVYDTLMSQHENAEKAIENVDVTWDLPTTAANQTDFPTRQSFTDSILRFREEVVGINVNVTVERVVQFYSSLNERLIAWIVQDITDSKIGHMWETLVSYHMLIVSKEQAGVERALGSTFYAE
ncbi:hypothetical protein BaRGS_00032650, partial [Batillaria attramentaria]